MQSFFYSSPDVKNDTLTKVFDSIIHFNKHNDKAAKMFMSVSHFSFIYFIIYAAA
jgi:hypothetical protein